MQKNKQSWLSVLAAIFTITVLILYIMVCFVPFIPLGILWIFNLPGLIFPFLFFILLILSIVYFITRSKWKWWCLVVLLLGVQQLAATFPLRISHKWTNEKDKNSIRILSWNVSSWDIANFTAKKGNTFHEPMMSFIKKQNADILCFQEFFEIIDPKIAPSFIQPFKKMGYPYSYFAPNSFTVSGKFQTGLAVFSKYPINDTTFFKKITAPHSEGFIYTDIHINSKIIRLFNMHLESVGFISDDYKALGKVKGSRTILKKLIDGYTIRNKQALELRSLITQSPFPTILCGDMNDIPNSTVYFTVKGSMQDAFIHKGVWPGRTFRFISPTIRIDYILVHKDFKINQFFTGSQIFSDHFPIITDIQYKN